MAGLEDIPPKLNNQGRIQNASSGNVILNAYPLNLENVVEYVHKYELKFTAQTARDPPQEKDLSAGPRNDIAKETRRRLLWECYVQMLEGNEDVFGPKNQLRGYVYDCGINFYSINKLLELQGTLEFPIEKERLGQRSQSYIGRMHNIRAKILCTEVINMRRMDAITEIRDRSVVQFLDILSTQILIQKDEYFIFASKMFEKASNIQLQQDPRVMKEGMQKNVRIVGDNFQDARPVLQLDAKKSAFFPELKVEVFAERMLRDQGNLQQGVFHPPNLRLLSKQLRGLTVITTHLKTTQRSFTINGLTEKPANQVTFEFNGEEIDVVTYYERQYQLRLRHPGLPCVVERRPGRGDQKVLQSYYPFEVLGILAGQRVPLDKQTPKLTEQMIRNCQAMPADFRDQTEKQRANAFIQNANPFFKAHNVRADTELITAKMDLLFPPAVVYDQNDRVEPNAQGLMQWKMDRGRRFLDPCGINIWAAVLVENCVSGEQCNNFLMAFTRSASQRGIHLNPAGPTRRDQLPNDPRSIRPGDPELPGTDIVSLRKLFSYYRTNNCNFVMFFTRDKTDPIHHLFKLMEVEFKVVTQHVTKPTLLKAIGDRGAQMVIDNIMLKFNLKLGGVNHGLSAAGAFMQLNRSSHDIVSKEWLSSQKMFIGLDMSHAPPQSVFERQAGVPPSVPTIVGMSYTMGAKVLKMRGTYWMQESRLTSIKYLKDKVKEALTNFNLENGHLPAHVMVFRGGASEGEYGKVASEERAAIQEAFKEFPKGPTQLTILVCQRASNYRIVPQNINRGDKAPDQNCKAGTVVDKQVMHPTYTEFLLIGHRTIQGTAQPVRCTVVYDAPDRVQLQELEYISYHLCYAHGIVTSPVSVPAPLYAATDLAKRGRNNWKMANFEGDDHGSDAGGKFAIRAPMDDAQQEHFFIDMSNQLKPTVATKFWA